MYSPGRDGGKTTPIRSKIKKPLQAGHWWLTPVILATQEAEIRNITVQSQPRQIVCKPPSRKYPSQKRASRVAQDEGSSANSISTALI
jgi:hypothetical protein